MSEAASATITSLLAANGVYQYTATLTDTGSTQIGTFWLAWVPGEDLLDSSPTNIVAPAGWTAVVTNSSATDGYAIQYKANTPASDLQSGASLSGFDFTSTETPVQLSGNSSFFPTPQTASFVYSGAPFSDAGFQFTAKVKIPGRTQINVTGYTVDENTSLTDDLFNIATGATLVLLGSSSLNDDAIEGSGLVRNRANLSIDDDLALSGSTLFVDIDSLVLNGDLLLGQSATDSVTTRNLAGANWDLNGNSIIGAGSSEFVNLGSLLDRTGSSTVDANFYDRGGSILIGGALDFGSPGDVNRFIDDSIENEPGASGTFELNGGVLVGSTVSTSVADLVDAHIVGDVTIASSNVTTGYLNLGAGSVLSLTSVGADVTFGDEIIGAGTIAIMADDTLATAYSTNGTTLVGDVTIANYADITFTSAADISFKFTAFAGDTITVENEGGATWTDTGTGGSFWGMVNSAGSALFINDGTFIENTSLGAEFGVAVENNGVIEAGAASGFYVQGLEHDVELSSVTGAGTIDIGADPVDVTSVGSGQTLNFDPQLAGAQAPILEIQDPSQFAGLITDFDQYGGSGEQINVIGNSGWQYQNFVENGSGTGGSLMFSKGGAETGLVLVGSYDPSGFQGVVSGNQTTITYSA